MTASSLSHNCLELEDKTGHSVPSIFYLKRQKTIFKKHMKHETKSIE